ncbi:hypothetical protein [Ruegeria arenilitoris]|uniref:hypothetical protein n=1 Tax=Ruegeria arenilitoris TaxID=1173585 RepID=UPI00148189DB|nr:hypothetical protein [Ruegeria arenilitoris]
MSTSPFALISLLRNAVCTIDVYEKVISLCPNSTAPARNAENIANNTAGIAAALSLAALQQNPHYDGIQTSFGLGYYDGKTGYSGLVGMKLNDLIYGNVGVSYGTEPGAVASITISW